MLSSLGWNPFGIQRDGNWTEGELGSAGREGDDGGISLVPESMGRSSAGQMRGAWEFRLMHGWESYAFDPSWYADYGVVRTPKPCSGNRWRGFGACADGSRR